MGTQVLFLIVLNNVLTTPNLDTDDAEDFRTWRRQSVANYLTPAGCGSFCGRSGYYLDRRASMDCADLPKNDSRFVAFLDNWASIQDDWGSDLSQGSDLIIRSLRDYGCPYLRDAATVATSAGDGQVIPPHFVGINFCVNQGTTWPVKPLSYFCPVACGCRRGDPHCPDRCPERDTPNEPTCSPTQRSPALNPTAGLSNFACPIMATATPTMNVTPYSPAS